MKKTQTKAFANLVCAVVLFVVEIWAYAQTFGFRVVKNAAVQPATFPRVMLIGMMVFTVVLFIQAVIKLTRGMSEDDFWAEPAASINLFKNRGVLAGCFVIVLCIIYVALFKTLGYVAVSAIVSAIIMVLIGKRNPLQIALVSILVPLGMWLMFYKMLTVNIPMGVLQPLRDLVDKIRF